MGQQCPCLDRRSLGGLEKQALAEIEACRIPLPSRQEQEGICRCAYEKAKEQMDAITTRSELRQYLQKEEGLLGTVVSAARPLADQAQKLQKKLDALEKKWEKEIGKKTAFYYGRLTEGRAALENINARLSPDSAAREIDAGLQHIRIMGQKEESRTDLGHDADRAGRGDPSWGDRRCGLSAAWWG